MEKPKEADTILRSTNKFHINLGLERTQVALEKFGNPQNDIKFIHVAGTNGKGSTCAMLNKILCTHFRGNKNIGLFTSPHLFSYCERISVNEKPISQEDLDKYVKLAASAHKELTEFEILTVAAFLYFRDKNVQYAVLEVGLGGRFDSTNVIKSPLCSVITTIDYDHTARLGNTIEEIAYQKAGIIKPNCPVVAACDNAGFEIIQKCANESDAPLYTPKKLPQIVFDRHADCKSYNYALIEGKKYDFALLGDHQAKNLALVLETLEHLPFKVSDASIEKALREVSWGFRLQYIPAKNILIDGAHNPSGIKSLRNFLDKYFEAEKKTFIFGCLNNKDCENMLKTLMRDKDELYFYEFDYPNALKFEQLPQNIKNRVQKVTDPDKLINETKNLKIICGSLYMIGQLCCNYFAPTPVEPNPPS